MIPTNKKQIVCISPNRWNDPWFRKQHFMLRFLEKGYTIAYIEPSISIARKLKISNPQDSSNYLFRINIEEIDKNLFIIRPTQYLPFYSRPIIRHLNNWYIFSRISRVLNKLGFRDYLLWLYFAEHLHILRYFDFKHLVFDIVDDMLAIKKSKNQYNYIKECTKSLITKSNLVIVTASTLLEKFNHLSSSIYLVQNGYDSDLFPPKGLGHTIPELKNMHRPIVGFVGTLFPYLDYDLIKYIITTNKNRTFVFVGPCEDSIKNRWQDITRYNNVIWLGKRPREEIPGIMKEFDICINPFKIDQLSKSVMPLKVFEYLAMGKPVVSVEMESLRRSEVGKLIYFTNDYAEFNLALDNLLKNPLPLSEYECVKKYSWDRLFNKLFDIFEQTIS